MKISRNVIALMGLIAAVALAAPSDLLALTNGFVIPTFRGSAGTEVGYWEVFTTAAGSPGNLPDRPGATSDAILIQTNASSFLTGSGNIYNPTAVSSFILTDATPFQLGTVVLQVRTVGSEMDYGSVSLTYTNDSGAHSLSPLFRYELDRTGGQGFNVSSLWQWDLSGRGVTNYSISFKASGPSMSFDSMTLDTSGQWKAAFAQQPFTLQSTPANLARWMYSFNGNPAGNLTASVFGSLGSTPDFDSRDAQFLLGWSTTNRIPVGHGATNYVIRRARVTLTIATGGQYVYTGALRDYRTYLPPGDSRYLPPTTTSSPVELFGAGFRGGFTNGEDTYIPYAATNYPQAGPWAAGPSSIFHTNRAAYAAGFDTNGVQVDVSNSVGDDGVTEVPQPFEVAPFAVGQSATVQPGQTMPVNSQLTFDLNLNDPLIYGYVQQGLNEGNLSFVVSSLVNASLSGPGTFPRFYTIYNPIATASQYPLLDLDGEIVRSSLDGDDDGLPDDWENFYFGSLVQGATTDIDGDRASNLAEYRSGTVPTDRTDVLRLLAVETQPSPAELHFAFAPSRQYTVQWSDDLLHWQTNASPLLSYSSAWLAKTGPNPAYPSPVFAVWRDTNAPSPQRFYRVSAQ